MGPTETPRAGGEWRRRELLVVAIALVAICGVVFGSILFGPSGRIASNPIGDGARYFVYQRGFYAEQLLAGNLPLWNPHVFSGLPFVGTFQTAVFYPFNLIYLLLPVGVALNLDLCLHLVLLGTFSFAWIRGWGLHPAAAFFAALMVMFGAPTFLRVLAGQLTVLDTLAWAPLLLMSVDRLSERSAPGWMLVGVLATTAMLLAGHPPTVYMAGVATALYAAARWPGANGRLRFACSMLPIALLPPLLAAVQLMTGLDVSREAIRTGGMTYEFATSFSFPPENLLTLLAPEAIGNADHFKRSYFGRWFYWDASAYVGLVGLLLAVHGAERGRGELRRIAALLFAAILVLSLGRYTPIYALVFDVVPGLDHFRAPSKFMFYASLFAAALSAVGIDSLLRGGAPPRAAWILGLGLVPLLCLGSLWVWDAPPTDPASPIHQLAELADRSYAPGVLRRWQLWLGRSLLISAGVFAGVALLFWLARDRRRAVWILLVLGGLELIGFAHRNRGGTWVTSETRRRPGLEATYSRAGEARVLTAGKVTDLAMRVGGHDLWGYDPVTLLRYAELMAFTQGRDLRELDNVVGRHPDIFHPLFAMLRGRFEVGPDGTVVEHEGALPRFVVVRDHRVVTDRDAILGALSERDFDPRRTVILEQTPVPAPSPADGPTAGAEQSLRVVDESSDHVALTIELEAPAILLITDAHASGWRARGRRDGQPAEYALLRANYALRAVPLAAGRHALVVEYAPESFRIGARVSLISALIVTLLAGGWGLHRRRAAARPVRSPEP
jgi:hypothetical protein